jgi:hypothetical protein
VNVDGPGPTRLRHRSPIPETGRGVKAVVSGPPGRTTSDPGPAQAPRRRADHPIPRKNERSDKCTRSARMRLGWLALTVTVVMDSRPSWAGLLRGANHSHLRPVSVQRLRLSD